jgi:hypothetical protein
LLDVAVRKARASRALWYAGFTNRIGSWGADMARHQHVAELRGPALDLYKLVQHVSMGWGEFVDPSLLPLDAVGRLLSEVARGDLVSKTWDLACDPRPVKVLVGHLDDALALVLRYECEAPHTKLYMTLYVRFQDEKAEITLSVNELP